MAAPGAHPSLPYVPPSAGAFPGITQAEWGRWIAKVQADAAPMLSRALSQELTRGLAGKEARRGITSEMRSYLHGLGALADTHMDEPAAFYLAKARQAAKTRLTDIGQRSGYDFIKQAVDGMDSFCEGRGLPGRMSPALSKDAVLAIADRTTQAMTHDWDRVPEFLKRGIVQSLSFGVVGGRSIEDVVHSIQGKVADVLWYTRFRAENLARTEIADAMRYGAFQTMKRAGAAAWTWDATLDNRACAICLINHGRVFPMTTEMWAHQQCRCVQVPLFDDEWDAVDSSHPYGGDLGRWRDVRESPLRPMPADRVKAALPKGWEEWDRPGAALTLPDGDLRWLLGVRENPRWRPSWRVSRTLGGVTPPPPPPPPPPRPVKPKPAPKPKPTPPPTPAPAPKAKGKVPPTVKYTHITPYLSDVDRATTRARGEAMRRRMADLRIKAAQGYVPDFERQRVDLGRQFGSELAFIYEGRLRRFYEYGELTPAGWELQRQMLQEGLLSDFMVGKPRGLYAMRAHLAREMLDDFRPVQADASRLGLTFDAASIKAKEAMSRDPHSKGATVLDAADQAVVRRGIAVYPADWVDGARSTIEAYTYARVKRGFCSWGRKFMALSKAFDHDRGVIDLEVVVHEFGHLFMYERRLGRFEFQWLMDRYQGANWRAYDGGFIPTVVKTPQRYTSKVYVDPSKYGVANMPIGGGEVFTTLVQDLLVEGGPGNMSPNSGGFIGKDRDLLQFVWAVLVSL